MAVRQSITSTVGKKYVVIFQCASCNAVGMVTGQLTATGSSKQYISPPKDIKEEALGNALSNLDSSFNSLQRSVNEAKQPWRIPDRVFCQTCHAEQPWSVLGSARDLIRFWKVMMSIIMVAMAFIILPRMKGFWIVTVIWAVIAVIGVLILGSRMINAAVIVDKLPGKYYPVIKSELVEVREYYESILLAKQEMEKPIVSEGTYRGYARDYMGKSVAEMVLVASVITFLFSYNATGFRVAGSISLFLIAIVSAFLLYIRAKNTKNN